MGDVDTGLVLVVSEQEGCTPPSPKHTLNPTTYNSSTSVLDVLIVMCNCSGSFQCSCQAKGKEKLPLHNYLFVASVVVIDYCNRTMHTGMTLSLHLSVCLDDVLTEL